MDAIIGTLHFHLLSFYVSFISILKLIIHILDSFSAMSDPFFTHYSKELMCAIILVSLQFFFNFNNSLIFFFCLVETISSCIIVKISFEILFIRIFRIISPIMLYLFSVSMLINLVLLVCLCLFKPTPMAHGSCQARGRIGAADASLCHSHSSTRSEPHLQPTMQLEAMPDPLTH